MSSAVCDAGGERPEGTDTTTTDTSLKFEMELPSGHTLTAVAGLNEYQYQDGLDADWLPLSFIGRADISDYDHDSQELRITSPTDGRFSWVGGVYLDKQVQEIDYSCCRRNLWCSADYAADRRIGYLLGIFT